MYDASKIRHKPKKTKKLKNKELLSIDDGGMSYWSNKTHRWIQGRFDKNKIFLFLQIKIYKRLLYYFDVFV